jgi:hypothetical protein
MDYKSHHELWERTLELVYSRYYGSSTFSLNQANILIGYDIYIIVNALFSTQNTTTVELSIVKPKTTKELIDLLKDKENVKYLKHCYDRRLKFDFLLNGKCIEKKIILLLLNLKKLCNLLKLNMLIGTLPQKKTL